MIHCTTAISKIPCYLLILLMGQLVLLECSRTVWYRKKYGLLPSDPWKLFNISMRANNNGSEGLFPNVFNLVSMAMIKSNATCGQNRPEQFCKLVEHVKRRPGDRIQCSICHANSSQAEYAHPISNAIDGTHRWWQSPTIANGWNYNWVTITLDLKQVYQVAYIIVTSANSPRPGNWILEKSLDGIDFFPWQYFAMTNSDCWNTYGVAPTIGVPRFKRDDEVICTSVFSKLDPLENGEIYVSLVNGRPGAAGPSEELMEFTTARFVRLRFQRIRTLNADLMLPFHYNLKYLDPTVTNRYYYSIKDVSIGGQCICHGHARFCPVDQENRELKCKCEGNTCGNSCEVCCPLFNQIPWHRGTYTEGAACEECNCFGHADLCIYNATIDERKLSLNTEGVYKGGGVCCDCKHNTMGINCELCEDGFFRPSGLDHSHPNACHPCLCDEVGATGLCVKDDLDEDLSLMSGDCICHEGYCGPRCDQCLSGFSGYPNCTKCPCSAPGSRNEDLCSKCLCKENVRGENCDSCLPGFYNLRAENPVGCDRCFCFSITNECHSATWPRVSIKVMNSWFITDLRLTSSSIPYQSANQSLHFLRHKIHHMNSHLYWLAPPDYIGNKVSSYGGLFRYAFHYSINRSAAVKEHKSLLADYDIILEGNGMCFGMGGQYFEEDIQHIVSINLTENGWVHLENSTRPPETPISREEFMVLLAEMDRFFIRALYSTRQTEMTLSEVNLDVAREDGSGPVMSAMEMCHCPDGYAGTSCESCAPGYRRVDNMLVGGVCSPCECNSHSDFCDPYSGECKNCKHNTRGTHCEICATGYHGDAKLNSPDSCHLCACPLESNSFADSCRIFTNDGGHADHVCLNCSPGHTGRHCESCIKGFYGNPLQEGSHCQPCECNQNAADEGKGICDSVSGQCYRCTGHTEGVNCQQCQDGYFGTAVGGNCTRCLCNPYGSVGNSCDRLTGQCHCRPRYIGHHCGECQAGYGDVESGCLPCKCSLVGSITSVLCDPVTGSCRCKEGISGKDCSMCLPGYYGFSSAGCQACSCHPFGSASSSCDLVTGHCQCLDKVSGRLCDQCLDDYGGLNSGIGCQPCNCNTTGSRSSQCSVDAGACICRSGVTGLRCNRCMLGYFGFSRGGCRKCNSCQKPGHVCDPITGKCICPPFTEGERCQRCQLDSWGYDAVNGCQPCHCSSLGSAGKKCEPDTGQCSCIAGYKGRQCDQCPSGYYGFPKCKPCLCDVRGTRSEKCRDNVCSCDSSTGQCLCKENVSGRNCDTCSENAFSLIAENRFGCTSCFCFGRSHQCTQAPYIWSQVVFPIEVLNGEPVPLNSSSSSMFMPDVRSNSQVSRFTYFWNLTKFVHGDKILSYNGRFGFKLGLHPGSEGSAVVSIYFRGNDHLHLLHNFKARSRSSRNSQNFEVVLKEDEWIDDHGHPLTRSTMMIALQNVQHWLIRVASKGKALQNAWLYDVTLDEALPSDLKKTNAFGIEMCVCPEPFTGLSCQNPVDGFYRQRPKATDIMLNPINLIGTVEPCWCNGRSKICDKESGKCQNCAGNTEGDHCESCELGFYDASSTDGVLECLPCACPLLIPSNNFSPSCNPSIHSDDYICNACLAGYTGTKCERCSPGYFGDPLIVGGHGCQPCLCHATGSRDQWCDSVTGQCSCHVGITGRACDVCQPGYAVVDGICLSCDEGCTGVLISMLNEAGSSMSKFNSSAAGLLPWAHLSSVDHSAIQLQKSLKLLQATDLKELAEDMPSLKTNAERLMHKAEELKMIADSEKEDASEARWKAAETLKAVKEAHSLVTDSIAEIRSLMPGGNDSTRPNVNAMYEESKELLDIIKSDVIWAIARMAEEEIRLAESMLKRVQEEATSQSIGFASVQTAQQSLESQLWDLKNITSNLTEQTRKTLAMNVQLRHLMDRLRESNQNITGHWASATELCQTAVLKNELASHFLWNVTNKNYQEGLDLLQEFRLKSEELFNRKKQLDQNISSLDSIIRRATEHAGQLEQQLNVLEQQFSGTRHSAEDPLKAATAYGDTKQAIDEAEASAKEAHQAANEAVEKIASSAFLDRVKELLNRSRLLNESAAEILTTVAEYIRPKYEKMNKVQTEASENMEDAKNIIMDISAMLNVTPKDIRDAVHELNYLTAVSLAKASKVEKSIANKTDLLHLELKPKLNEMKSYGDEGLRRLNESVVMASSQVNDLINQTQLLHSQKNQIQRIGVDIGESILKLRRMIDEARAQANSIKVSLYHQGRCIRKYALPKRSSLINSITLHFKTNATDMDQLLFLLRNRNNSDFLALEMVDQRIRFVWNVGDGNAFVEHEEVIESYFGKTDEKDMWYHVHAERVGNVGRLLVHKLSSPVPDQEVENSSPPGYMRLDLVEDVDLFIAGVPSDLEMPEDLMSSSFDGCIGMVQIDGQALGLFNFRRLVQNVDCQGCFTVPIADKFTSPVYQFNGHGYTSMPQVRYLPERLSVSFKFKSFWKDALLFYTASSSSGDFISIEMKNGRVIFRFGFMRKYETSLSTQLTYNTNEWIEVRAVRIQLQGVLEVNEERITGASPDMGIYTMDLASSPLFFAGIPHDVKTDMHNITRLGFLGCFQETTVVSRGSYVQDFLEGRYVGMSLGCQSKANVVGLPGLGHMEFPSPNIPSEGGIAISFRTQQEDALILLAFGTQLNHYYSLSIIDGRVSAWLNAGSGVTRVTSEKKYNNGQVHSVTIHKSNRLVELYVDNMLVGSSRLPPNSATIHGMRGSEGGLYVGGIPFGILADGMSASLKPFKGCLMDLLVNNRVLPFDLPVAFDSVDVGRCIESDLFLNLTDQPQMKVSTTPTIPSFTVTVTVPVAPVTARVTSVDELSTQSVIPTGPTPEPVSCAKEVGASFISGAVSFGDIRHGNAEVELERLNVAKFNISMSLRTYYDKGQIFYIGNKNRVDFIALYLLNGVIEAVYMDHRGTVKTLSSDLEIGDGLWHSLRLVKGPSSIGVQIDEAKPMVVTTSQDIVVLSPIYVGGLPKDHKAHASVLRESFKGCIRNFEVNGQLIDLANSKVIMGFRQCFTKSEPGVHFDGYSYAIFAEKYYIASDLSLSFEFRTTRQNGVIFSISHPTGMPALALEMVDGRIKFTAVNIDNIYSTESETCDYCLCDDHWHTVRADLIRNLVTLKVDGGKLTVSLGPGNEMILGTNHELYIGGFPVNAGPQGATHTSEFFQGCLRNVRINNTLIDWHTIDSLTDVHVSGCPLSEL